MQNHFPSITEVILPETEFSCINNKQKAFQCEQTAYASLLSSVLCPLSSVLCLLSSVLCALVSCGWTVYIFAQQPPKLDSGDLSRAHMMLRQAYDDVKQNYYDPKYYGVDLEATYHQ